MEVSTVKDIVSSVHFSSGLPHFLVPSILAVIFLGIPSLSIVSVCPYHLNLSNIIHFIMSASCNIASLSLFVLILQLSSFMEP